MPAFRSLRGTGAGKALNAAVIYGTAEAKKIVSLLEAGGVPTLTVVGYEYGGGGEGVVRAGQAREWWDGFLREARVGCLVDASHPFASALSQTACQACTEAGVPFFRFFRPGIRLPDSPLIHTVAGFAEAAQVAASLGQTIFLTTGSGDLETFLGEKAVQGKRVVVRVLPEARLITRCRELGIMPRDIVGLQGPFSVRFNQAIFTAYGADVVVTREGGRASGTSSKIKAALNLGVPVVVVLRPANTGFLPGQVFYSSRQVVDRVLATLGRG